LFSFLVQRYVSGIYLTANWSATLFSFSTLFTTHTAHPVENLCAINRPFSVFSLLHEQAKAVVQEEEAVEGEVVRSLTSLPCGANKFVPGATFFVFGYLK